MWSWQLWRQELAVDKFKCMLHQVFCYQKDAGSKQNTWNLCLFLFVSLRNSFQISKSSNARWKSGKYLNHLCFMLKSSTQGAAKQVGNTPKISFRLSLDRKKSVKYPNHLRFMLKAEVSGVSFFRILLQSCSEKNKILLLLLVQLKTSNSCSCFNSWSRRI